jgi:hypothetical protein
MFGHDNTISKHQTIKGKTFWFLVRLANNSKSKPDISVVNLIDYIDELKTCDKYQIDSPKHQIPIKSLETIINCLTGDEAPGKMEIDDLLHNWMKADADLEHCRTTFKHY